jgi:hypothetical protein
MVVTFVHTLGTGPLKLWEENVNWSYENPLFYEKTRKFYLEAITFYRISKVVFAIYTRKIRFHFRPRSYKDDILTQTGIAAQIQRRS